MRFTPFYHSAIYAFLFPKSDSANILLDLTHNIPINIKTVIGGTVSEGSIKIAGNLTARTQVHRNFTIAKPRAEAFFLDSMCTRASSPVQFRKEAIILGITLSTTF